MFQPGGLVGEMRLGRGGAAAEGGCSAAAGGGHWLLVGSEPLPEAIVDGEKENAGSAWFRSDKEGNHR